MTTNLPSFLSERPNNKALERTGSVVRTPFLEKGVHYIARIIKDGYAHWESARRDGFLQEIDPRVKLLFLTLALVVVSLKRHPAPQVAFFVLIFLLYLSSRLDIGLLYRRILVAGLLFGILIPLPSALNLVMDGKIILPIFRLSREYNGWGIHLPETIGITREGLSSMGLLTLRVMNSVALSLLILYTTSFPALIKALRVFRVPDSFIAIITLSYKYVVSFARTVEEMHLAKKSRLVHGINDRESRLWVAGRIAYLFSRTQSRCLEIHKAMISRGMEHQPTVAPFEKLRRLDWVATVAGTAILAAILYW